MQAWCSKAELGWVEQSKAGSARRSTVRLSRDELGAAKQAEQSSEWIGREQRGKGGRAWKNKAGLAWQCGAWR